ncbi:hypothetical protein GFS24_06435 [Chitinophaga sp. SYP-B3965]|uniref:hypothetical protein n=1 Tax=Chitinophaga sp. SYP-B3965 TaxID=2663120 RepID=UPI001299A0C4|nr:hypothetical protein [Chitinophaga sp. SYP-B3965]MRG44742.1 hypothetical protein [Chitinophaga sp. SYP-B3965]
MKMKPIAFCCLLLFGSQVRAQSETIITVDVSLSFMGRNKLLEKEVMQSYFRCYKEYIIERIFKMDMEKIKKPDDIKPPFYNDSSYYFINTALQKFVEFDAFAVSAKATSAQDLPLKKLGLLIKNAPTLDSASRIADTTMDDIKYIRYRAFKLRMDGKTMREITAYLLPVPNTSSYSYHRKIESEAQGRFVWVDTRDVGSPHPSITVRLTYETREIPRKEWKVMDSWISRTKW